MNRNYFYRLTTCASLASFQFGSGYIGYTLAVINNIQGKISANYPFINLLGPFGAIFGCFIGSSLANRYGRRYTIIIADIVGAVGNAMVMKN